ncbi:hypothetical protein MVEN_00024600 [Mycena venus]|uniref:Uncharacterized protein n=1 Tax=Mycena venus TaxID=2733690 RepID=A0A8H6Z658_9AGAR|nr:hypothetical protein MVEN_00024600 [Mycena venus]
MSGNQGAAPSGDTPTAATTANTSQFASAASQQGSTARAASPQSLQNNRPPRRLKLTIDENKVAYLVDPTTGERYDVSDDENVLSGTPPRPILSSARSPDLDVGSLNGGTPSSESDVTQSIRGETTIPSEGILAALVDDLSAAPLTDAQLRRFQTLRGVLSRSRESLFTTTGLVAGQRDQYRGLAQSLRGLRDEVATRLEELGGEISDATHRLENTLENNLRILRATGTTDQQLTHLAEAVRRRRAQPINLATRLPTMSDPLANPVDLGELRETIDRALPPPQDSESAEEFYRRGNAALGRRVRTAASFDPDHARTMAHPTISLKATRFAVDGGSENYWDG